MAAPDQPNKADEPPMDATVTYPSASRAVKERIGRYRLVRILGEGGFGKVCLAHDDELARYVAIKVPATERLAKPEHAEEYLAEARTLASLDHPNLVPVYDVGGTEDGSCYVVYKYIEGRDLAKIIAGERPSHEETAELIATVARALHHAHDRRLVHRDVKPANILVEETGRAYVADFGLALREEDFGKGSGVAGTPAYMSPEQAGGEGHRLDARSDIFSLGVVFYELLTGKRPFLGSTKPETLQRVITTEPSRPCEIDENIPSELERICLKALAKRASDRYATAQELADDLIHWKSGPVVEAKQVEIVPRGLRSFDADDAGFFLELLPGLRNREGLPESIQFWKTRIDETDPDKTFTVGLMYGPSGCGKSSLVKAGLLPRLADHVIPVYVEATPEETETRIIRGLWKHVPGLPDDLSLVDTFSALRRGLLPSGKKVVVVLDQFEQWLHAKRNEENTELGAALRQCDGRQVQCVVMVRDDFWMATTRFMRDLDIRLLEGINSTAVDLFDEQHARKVLADFGRAYGRLPASPEEHQNSFLQEAVTGLAQDGKVVSVRLALFAEMVKGRTWRPTTLAEIGGSEGVGVTFLDETFSARTAPPEHRLHQQAAREVLKALLPEHGTDIKGSMRLQTELREASGYCNRPRDFDDLLRILDGDMRLITPTEPEAATTDSGRDPRSKCYQLTHDYLVPSLREWLTRKQKETRRGRAGLRLAEQASLWNAKPENRHLPAWWEWASIRLLTESKKWPDPQRKMMRRATSYHLRRTALLLLLIFAVLLGALEFHRFSSAKAQVQQLATAEIEELPGILSQLQRNRRYADRLLRRSFDDAAAGRRQKVNIGLALANEDPNMLEFSLQRLLDSDLATSLVLRDLLYSHRNTLSPRLWQILDDASSATDMRFRSALALAKYNPPGRVPDRQWQQHAEFVVAQLMETAAGPPGLYARVVEALKPMRHVLLPLLGQTLLDRSADPHAVVALLSDYARDEPEALSNAILNTEPEQFRLLFRVIQDHRPVALHLLAQELDRPIPTDAADERRRHLVKRKMKAGIALAKLGREEHLCRHLRHTSDPELRSQLVHQLVSFDVDPAILVSQISQPVEVSVLRALLLALGQYKLGAKERADCLPALEQLLLEHSDAGVHSAVEWLLRAWKEDGKLGELSAQIPCQTQPDEHDWFVNTESHTLALIDARQKPGIKRRFALGTKEVSVEQFRRFRPDWRPKVEYAPTADCPANLVSWYDAVAYCNWLSQKEGIDEDQLCYREMDDELHEYSDFASRCGYRLPTVAEWRYGSLAGATTSRFFGWSDELMNAYAWHAFNAQNRMWPGGLLEPNDFGLYDVYGNALEWCNDGDEETRKLLGGSKSNLPSDLGSLRVGGYDPSTRFYSNSFRIARTIPEKQQ